MTQPSLGAYATAFEAVRRYRPHRDSLHNILEDLLDGMDDTEAKLLPKSMADIMPLLKSDIHRLRFAADFLARLDLYESAGAVLTAAVQTRDHQLMLSAASLGGNPAVEAPLRDRIQAYADGNRAIMIRLSSDVMPSSQSEEWLYLQCWPGARTVDKPLRFAPVVVLDIDLPPANSLRLAAMMERFGATIRRLDTSAPIPNWFGNQTALVCTPKNQNIVHSKYPKLATNRIFAEQLPSRSDRLTRLAHRVYNSIPRVRNDQAFAIDKSQAHVWNTDNYSLGVYGTNEIRFLTGATDYLLRKLVKQDYIQPRKYGQSQYYRFADIVAIRTYVHLQHSSSKRISADIVPSLARFAGDNQAVNIGATAAGDVLVDHGDKDGWIDIETGQATLELDITKLDDVFEPFQLGNGRVPGLLNVSVNTRLSPSTLNGMPYLHNHRITATTLAILEEQGTEYIYHAYPELKNTEFQDTVDIGKKLIYMC